MDNSLLTTTHRETPAAPASMAQSSIPASTPAAPVQFQHHHVAEQPKPLQIAADIYSEKAMTGFHRAFPMLTSRTVKAAKPCLLSVPDQDPLAHTRSTPAIIPVLNDIYKQFAQSFGQDASSARIISYRLSAFLSKLEQESRTPGTFDLPALLLQYPKIPKTPLVKSYCAACARETANHFSRESLLFLCGLLAICIEIEEYMGYRVDSKWIPHHFLADALLSISSQTQPFFISHEATRQYMALYDDKVEPFFLFPDRMKHMSFSLLFLSINNHYWAEIHHCNAGLSDDDKQEAMWAYFYKTAAPRHICNTIFKPQFAYEQSCFDQLGDKDLPSALSATHLTGCPFQLHKVKFGEEFEFNYLNTAGQLYSTTELMQMWIGFLSTKILSMGIPQDQFSIMIKNGVLLFTFGDWHCKFYHDYGVFEVNCSPYTLDQLFTCHNQKFTAYQLFDLFILEPAQQFLLREISGHKHVDIRYSIASNPELLFRFLLAVENESHLAQAVGRAAYSRIYFPYLYMCMGGPQWQELIKQAIQLINQEIAIGTHSHPTGFYTCAHVIQQIWAMKHKYAPARIRLTPRKARSWQETKVCPPDGTMELRFWHGARSGREARAINEIILAWMQTLAQEQQDKVPLSYTPYDVEKEVGNQQIKDQFHRFCEKIGLNSGDYDHLLRLD